MATLFVCSIRIEVCSMSEVPHKGEAMGLMINNNKDNKKIILT